MLPNGSELIEFVAKQSKIKYFNYCFINSALVKGATDRVENIPVLINFNVSERLILCKFQKPWQQFTNQSLLLQIVFLKFLTISLQQGKQV
jgi:hypothetical protein